jgi:hypothetical protein
MPSAIIFGHEEFLLPAFVRVHHRGRHSLYSHKFLPSIHAQLSIFFSEGALFPLKQYVHALPAHSTNAGVGQRPSSPLPPCGLVIN